MIAFVFFLSFNLLHRVQVFVVLVFVRFQVSDEIDRTATTFIDVCAENNFAPKIATTEIIIVLVHNALALATHYCVIRAKFLV